MYIDVLLHIARLRESLGENSRTYKSTCQAFADHPDLKAFTEGGVVSLCSESANPYMTHIDVTRGQDIYVYPFLDDKGSVIRSSPPFFYIGSRNPHGFGILPNESWTQEMEEAKISSDIIKKTKNFLSANVPYDIPTE